MKEFLIVAHGFPSQPDPADAALRALAERVGALMPEARVAGATLAKAGSLERALAAQPGSMIYPFFMAEGWFTSTRLPRRLAELGSAAPVLPPFGRDPALPDLVAKVIAASGAWRVILAAHGSKVSRSSKQAALAMAEHATALLPGRSVTVAFLEEPPHLRDIAARLPDALCLPFFALRAGHVDRDIPEALQQAGFRGELLPAIGEDAAVPALIAAALNRA